MIKQIELNGKTIEYDLVYKNVKNINLRIRPDGSIHVSANRRVPRNVLEDFLVSRADFIFNALEKFANRVDEPLVQYFSESEIYDVILGFCVRIYPWFENRGIKYPQIRFRRMVSQWGNCHSRKRILTFNTNLMYAPPECIEYVVAHEFTHFLVPNHSASFYDELARVMPDWKVRRQKLKKIMIA